MSFDQFFKEWSEGKEIEVNNANSVFSPAVIKVNEVLPVKGDNNHDSPLLHDPSASFLQFNLEVLDGEFRGLEFSAYQRIFFNDGNLSSPVVKSYIKKDGSVQANSLCYDILNAARENGDDRFKRGFSPDLFKNLTFKMGLKKGTSKEGKDFYVLETDYEKRRYEEYKRENNSNQLSLVEGEPTKNSVRLDPDDLPF